MRDLILTALAGAVLWWVAVGLAFWQDWRAGLALLIWNLLNCAALGMLGQRIGRLETITAATNRRVDRLELNQEGSYDNN